MTIALAISYNQFEHILKFPIKNLELVCGQNIIELTRLRNNIGTIYLPIVGTYEATYSMQNIIFLLPENYLFRCVNKSIYI